MTLAAGRSWRDRLARIAVGLVCVALLWPLRDLRFAAVVAITTHDARPGSAPPLPRADGAGVTPTDRLRVVLIDGAGADTAATMPTWNALCARGLDLTIDVGFPTVSLPVELALWSGRTQQQTGVLYHATGKPVLPLSPGLVPPRVPGSIAVAESAQYIVHSLGFTTTLPPITADKKLPEGWAATGWIDASLAAVASPTRLAFVHVLRVDSAGHKFGKRSPQWRDAAATSDAVLARLVAAAPDARWLVLADHDHLPTGGHGSEDRAIRVVRGCLYDPSGGFVDKPSPIGSSPDGSPSRYAPDLAPGRGGPISITDVARLIADSVEVPLADDAHGRPLAAALAAPVDDDDMLPKLPRGRVALALLVLAIAIAATAWGMRGRLWAGPWWWPVSLVSLMLLATTPSLSTPMIYKKVGLDMVNGFAPGLGVLAVTATLATRGGWVRALAAQLALPVAGALAVWIVTGATGLWFGDAVCPVVPRWTGWLPPITFIAATGLAVGGLVALASAFLPGSDPSAPSGTSRSDRAAP